MKISRRKSKEIYVSLQNRIRLVGAGSLDYDDRLDEQLRPFVPTSLDAGQDNYGQGEGQIRIEDALWGVYFTESSNERLLQFEEGMLDPARFLGHIEAIRREAERFFSCSVRVEIEGMHSPFSMQEGT